MMSQKLAAEIADGIVFAHNDLLSGKRCPIALPAPRRSVSVCVSSAILIADPRVCSSLLLATLYFQFLLLVSKL